MAKSPQALTRQTILEYVGPSVADIIFFERKDSRLPGYAAPPEYGTAHPDTSKWPGHKLALVRPDRNEPGYVLWYYVADRENHRVQVFDGNGKYETQWVNMHRPCGLYCCRGSNTGRRAGAC